MAYSETNSQAPNLQNLRTVFRRFLTAILPKPITHGLFGTLILLLDALTGPFLTFPILFVIPVTCAAWFCGSRTAVMLAFILPIGRAFIAGSIEQGLPWPYAVANASIRIFVLLFIARTTQQRRKLEHEVEQLKGILLI